MIAVETRPFDQFEKTQTLLEKAAQWAAVTVEMVEDREIQHAANSVTPPPNAANLAGRWSIKTARGRAFMRKTLFCLVAAVLAAVLAASSANAQQTVKIGLIMAYSGQFADTATQMDNGIKLYIKQHGDTVAGKKIEIIRKDTGGPNPDVAKRLAQELVVRDQVDVIAGFTLTPEALGAGDVSTEAKKLMVVMNAATSVVTEKSPYIVRVSLTLPQIGETLGTWAATKGKIKKAYTMVTDYGPGIDGEQYFQRGFKESGGEIIGSVRTPWPT